MKHIIIATFITLMFISLSASEMQTWLAFGTAQTEISGKYTSGKEIDSFAGFQIEYTFIKEYDNSFNLGGTFMYVERGWIEKDNGDVNIVKNCNIEGYIRVGYTPPFLEIIKLTPFVGIGATSPKSSTKVDRYKLYDDFPIYIGTTFTFADRWVSSNYYSIGSQNVAKNIKAKYNSISSTLGYRF